MRIKALGLIVAGLLAVPAAAQAVPIELVTNGGFETGTLAGWSCTGADSCFADSAFPHTGSFEMRGFDNDGFATLTQTVTTTPAALYNFSFFSFANVPAPGNILRYQLDGGPIVLVPQTASYAMTFTPFIAPGTSTSINFYFETDPGTGTWQIDDVSMTAAAAVPEPATLSLLGLGLVGLVARRRNRR